MNYEIMGQTLFELEEMRNGRIRTDYPEDVELVIFYF